MFSGDPNHQGSSLQCCEGEVSSDPNPLSFWGPLTGHREPPLPAETLLGTVIAPGTEVNAALVAKSHAEHSQPCWDVASEQEARSQL